MHRMHAAPIAEFIEFDLQLNLLLVLVSIIIPPFADGAAKRDQPVSAFNFCHGEYNNVIRKINQ